MGRAKGPRAKPHARSKSAKRDQAAMAVDDAWADEIEERLTRDAHDYQLDAIRDPSLYVSLLVGRGGGKTTALRVRAIIKMVRIRGARILYAADSKPTARELNWDPTVELIDHLGLRDDFEFHDSRMIMRCKRTGSTYRFAGLENKREVNKYRGQPFDEVQVDETASHDQTLLENFLDRAVGPRLGERGGCIVLAGSPGHVLRGRFYDVTRDGVGEDMQHRPYRDRAKAEFKAWAGYSSHAWSMIEVMALPKAKTRYRALVANWDRALRDKKAKGWTDDNPIWRREYLGKWAADNTTAMYQYLAHKDGALWNRWEPFAGRKLEGVQAIEAAIAALPDDVRHDLLFAYGMDMGSKDPFALVILAFSPTDEYRRFFHVYSFERSKMYANTIAKLLIGDECTAKAMRGEVYTELGGLFGVTGWPVAAVADLAALGEAVITDLQKVYGIKIKAAEKKNKGSAIEVVNGDLVDGRLFILADTVLEGQLAGLQWKPDEYGQPREDKAASNHSADGLTYIRTEVGAMFSGRMQGPVPTAPRPERAAAPGARAARPNAPTKPRPRGAPVNAGRNTPIAAPGPRGEFGALLKSSNFGHLRR